MHHVETVADACPIDRPAVGPVNPYSEPPDSASEKSSAQHPHPSGVSPRLLWIDDEVLPDDVSITLLRLDGFSVECAASGNEGLRLALRRSYDGILLDLNLPDISGLAILQRLAAAAVESPVLVLTGYGTADNIVAALRLGASDVKSKPLFADDLIAAVHGLTSAPADRGTRMPRQGVESDEPYDQPSGLRALCRELAGRLLNSIDFIALARVLRLSRTPRPGRPEVDAPNPLLSVRLRQHASVAEILRYMEEDLAARRLPSIGRIAGAIGLKPIDARRALRHGTRASFPECRRALRLRPAVSEVAFLDDQFAQIAYRIGYEYPGQFDRDFRLAFGMTPSEFRHVVQG
jgi:CheY-like chemotaxis protein/AraC-like DNA-binding protein